jgi:hypothetical protein
MSNTPKVMVGCRMSPDLKATLESDAEDVGISLSSLIETVLELHYQQSDDIDVLQTELNSLRAKATIILPKVVTENDLKIEGLVRNLKVDFPNKSADELIIAALSLIQSNKQNFFTYDLSDFFNDPDLALKIA